MKGVCIIVGAGQHMILRSIVLMSSWSDCEYVIVIRWLLDDILKKLPKKLRNYIFMELIIKTA